MNTNLPIGYSIARGLPQGELISWDLRKSDELFKLEYGKALVASSREEGSIPVYGTNGQCGWHSSSIFSGPGIILGRKGQGPLGVEYCPRNFWVIDTAYSLKVLENASLKYCYYMIKYVGLNHLKDGTSNPTLSRDSFGRQLFPIPPIADQEAIAHILGTLDDKIELNRETNETLEGIAKTLFKSWFVDFDPVRAKAEGRPTGLSDEMSDLFPDSFEESELGEIPSGWSVSSIKDQSSYLSRGISPKYCEDDEGVVVLNQKCIRDGAIDFSKSRRHDPAKKKIEGRVISRFDCLVNSTGVGTLGRVAIVPELAFGDVIVDSHVTVVRGSSEHSTFYLTNTLLNRQPEIEALGEGSTGQTELSRAVLGEMGLVVPPEGLLNAFFSLAVCLFEKRWSNESASTTLSSLRDALLPRLISGELRVPDAEKMLEEAGV